VRSRDIWKLKQEIEFEKVRKGLAVVGDSGDDGDGEFGVLVVGGCPFGWGWGGGVTAERKSQVTAFCHSFCIAIHGASIPKRRTSVLAGGLGEVGRRTLGK